MDYRRRLEILVCVGFLITLIGFACQSNVISAASLYIQQDEWQTAERLLQDELAVHPKNAEAWFLLGKIAQHNGIYTSAVVRFEEAARLDTTLKAKCAKEIDSIPYEVVPDK